MEADEEVAAAAEGYDGGGGGGAGAGRKEEEERRKTKSKFDERKKNEKEARREEEKRRASSTRMNPKPNTLCPCLRWVKLFDGHRRSKWSARKTGTPLWKTADFRGILAESRLFLSCFFVSFFFVAVFFQKNAGERVYFSMCFWSRKREFVKRESAEDREKKERRRRPNRGDGVAGAVAPHTRLVAFFFLAPRTSLSLTKTNLSALFFFTSHRF